MGIFDNKSSRIIIISNNGTIIYVDPRFSQEGLTVGASILDLSGRKNAELDDLFCVQTPCGIMDLHHIDTVSFKGLVGILCNDAPSADAISKLEEFNKELEAIFESSHDGIVVADSEGVFIRINSSYERITGIPKDDILGLTAAEIVDAGIVSDSATLRVLRTGRPYTSSQTFRSGRQSIITGSPIFDDNNNIFRVVTNVRDMTEINRLREELAQSKEKLHHYSRIVESLTAEQMLTNKLIFRSRKMAMVCDAALKFAKVEAPLLITGESGVGKEVIADLVFKNSLQKGAPFLKINCGAIPETLLESELFGYEGGAFTGAKKEGLPGLFEMANGGAVLLDEIGELSLALQVKLLRFVQQKEFYRVGGKKIVQVDVRVIAATNRDLQEMVRQKQFRSDLFYRLNVLKINIPPLRDRVEDIIPLVNFFLDKFNKKYSAAKRISGDLYRILEGYSWVGNVRELENLIERLVVICERDEITADYLPEEIKKATIEIAAERISEEKDYRQAKEEFEKEFFRRAIEKFKTSRRAAERLGIDHSTIVKKAAKYGLELLPRPGAYLD